MNKRINTVLFISLVICVFFAEPTFAQRYVQPERNDTTYLMPKRPFDVNLAKSELGKGTATIKGVAFIRPKNHMSFNLPGKKLYANKILIKLFPVNSYFNEFLDLKKKENPKKLKFAFMSPKAFKYRLEAVTNSSGEFTFPNMKPGKYYIEGIINWTRSGTYQQYTGSGYDNYGDRADYYQNQNYTNYNQDLIKEIVEVNEAGEVVHVKLN
ncbi:hypothetical protein ABIB40_000261 [Pedobacter sp. UYP30]|uniref:hypothetical protein n=1 Tax=Pedobacter sp. UYP30 TaxID=1756400 RepID=UPI003393EE5F